MRKLAAAAVLLLASCQEPSGQCTADGDCLPEQVCGPDALCVPGTRPPPGDAPVGVADAYALAGAGPFDVAKIAGVLANDTYTGTGTLTAAVVDRPAWGTLFLAPDGSFTYAPIQGFTGDDGFTYRATDGTVSSGVTAVTLTVSP